MAHKEADKKVSSEKERPNFSFWIMQESKKERRSDPFALKEQKKGLFNTHPIKKKNQGRKEWQ
jgi:hypothetical protein